MTVSHQRPIKNHFQFLRKKELDNSISPLWIKHPLRHNELHVFRMCLRCTKAMLKWYALCLMHSLYYMWGSLKVKQSCRMCGTFAYLCFNDLLLQPWNKLQLSFMVISPTCAHLRTHTNKHTRHKLLTDSREVMNLGTEGSVPIFYSCRVERGNDERRVVYLWEVNIDTTPAQKMTGLRSRVVVQGEARLSTWQHCNSNAVPSLKACGHCHHSSNDPCWRCCAVSWGGTTVTMIAVYRFEFETEKF